MTELEEKIKKLSDAYYQGNELISDEEYDALVKQLKKEKPDSELFGKPIGSDLKGVTKKYKHKYIVTGTLAKVQTIKDFSNWYSKYRDKDLIVETKEDGCSAEIIYKDGKLIQAISRGDGIEGEDITSNILKIPSVVKTIDNFTGGIRGEITMKFSVFDKFFKDKSANPRNMAAGIMKRLDVEDCEKLNFIAYDIVDENKSFNTELEKLNTLKEYGFDLPMWWAGAYEEDIIEFRNNIPNLRKELDRGIDGIVIKQNKVNRDDLDRLEPLEAVAFKPELEIAISKVLDIEWSLKGTLFSPVAIIEPVDLCGTTVSRASLSNINKMEELNIKIGSSVKVVKRGEIIPKIEGVV